MSSVDSSNPPLAVALERLANHRTRRTRDSQDVFNAGMVVLEKNAVNKMGDERWAFLEQLALAALDVGRTDIADTCIGLLNNQFSDSPRVDCLKGIKIEATAGPEAAREYYESLLEADSSNVAIWKRLITVYRSQGNVDKTVEELHQFLDTVYTDLEGWLELADVYDSVGLYTSALQALSHAILLAPQNQFYILKAAETADKAGDVPLALKMHLLVIDMATDDDDPKTSTDPPGGVAVRAWMGVKSTSSRLLSDARLANASTSKTSAPTPEKLRMLEGLALEELRSTGGKGTPTSQLTDEQKVLLKQWVEVA